MKNTRRIMATIWTVWGLFAASVPGQDSVITSLQGNGQLAWTNTAASNGVYRVEWASQAGGPWYQTFDNIGSMDSRNKTGFTVAVPMFYRVVMATNQPPPGMVWIDGGDVELGQVGVAVPVHTNFISGFWMDEMEVTKSLWDSVYLWAITNGYTFDSTGLGKTNNHPVQTVNWYTCVKWCNARSQKEGLTPCYYTNVEFSAVYQNGRLDLSNDWVNWSANGYRLPTEAEWEKAARGGRQGHLFPWGGDTIQHSQANYLSMTNYPYDISPTLGYHPAYNDGVFPFTSPVGSFPANGFGLHDMAGNVFEWCWDWFGDYSAAYQVDPHGPATGEYGVFRILRGGSAHTFASHTRVALHAKSDYYNPVFELDYVGFRCVKGR